MGYPRVQSVVTVQGNDLSALCNDLADQETMPPRVLVACGITESNLNERAERWAYYDPQQQRAFNLTAAAQQAIAAGDLAAVERILATLRAHDSQDVSFGWLQQTVGYAPIGDRSLTVGNVLVVRDLLFDPAQAAAIAAPQLGRFWRQYQDGPETLGRYNWPARGLQGNPNRANIERGWRESEAYMGWAPEDVRDQFPFEGCELGSRPVRSITEVIYHHGASRTPAPVREDELALMQEYHRLHVEKGWCVFAYHLAIGPSGTVYRANGLDLITYHATIANTAAVGIVFLGNFEAAPPSEAMLNAAVRARRWVAEQVGVQDLPFRGHKDVAGGTACPGGWWPALRARLEYTVPEPVPEPQPEPEPPTETNEQRLVNLVGYLSGDVADALQVALDSIGTARTAAQRQAGLEAAQAALNTLKAAH